MELNPPLVLASLSGESNAQWALKRTEYVGMVCLGGFSMDRVTRAASARMVSRGRDEFLYSDPVQFIQRQLETLVDTSVELALNVRSATLQGLLRVANLAKQYDSAVEINAHCRQPEMLQVGCGETLLRDTKRLCRYIRVISETGVTTGVKGRFEVDSVDSVEALNRCVEAGADYLHVDAMDSEPLIRRLEAPYLVANNGVRDRRHVEKYRRFGADAVSVARASDPPTLKKLHTDVKQVFHGVSQR